MINNELLGARLKDLRISKGKSFTETYVAKTIDVAVSTYCNYEKGRRRPSYEKLRLLASLYNTTIDYLLSNEAGV